MTIATPRYALKKIVPLSFEEADRKVWEALQAEGFGILTEIDVGLLLPCNVVYQADEEGTSVVAIMDPVAQLSVANNASLDELGAEVRSRLERVLESL